MKNKNIVITGGCGFIGSNIAEYLSNDNNVTIIDNLSTGKKENIKGTNATFVKGDINDSNLLSEIFKDIDYVFHLAAIPSVPRSVKDPITTNNANINGTLNILSVAKNTEVKKIIYSSSSSVYGDTPTLPKKENMKPCPLSPYAVSKLTGEYYCKVFTECYGLKTVSLRYFNVYGPRQDPNSEYAAVVPKFIKLVSNGKPPVVYGDGSQTRDFTYVGDVVNANVLSAEHSDCTGVFNVAGGRRITINELADSIIKNHGSDGGLSPVYECPRPGDILHSLADISKAKTAFGYEPEYDIKKGLKKVIEWYQKQI